MSKFFVWTQIVFLSPFIFLQHQPSHLKSIPKQNLKLLNKAETNYVKDTFHISYVLHIFLNNIFHIEERFQTFSFHNIIKGWKHITDFKILVKKKMSEGTYVWVLVGFFLRKTQLFFALYEKKKQALIKYYILLFHHKKVYKPFTWGK